MVQQNSVSEDTINNNSPIEETEKFDFSDPKILFQEEYNIRNRVRQKVSLEAADEFFGGKYGSLYCQNMSKFAIEKEFDIPMTIDEASDRIIDYMVAKLNEAKKQFGVNK